MLFMINNHPKERRVWDSVIITLTVKQLYLLIIADPRPRFRLNDAHDSVDEEKTVSDVD